MKLFDLFRQSSIPHSQNARQFLDMMEAIAPRAGLGAHGFRNEHGEVYGFVPFITTSPQSVTIHRLWAQQPGGGNGTRVLKKICDLADHYGVELRVKALPFGSKPYPMSREQLVAWFERHGFAGSPRRMTRIPHNSDISQWPSPDSGL